MDTAISDFTNLLERLKKNEEALGMEQLMGKHKKSYMALKKNVADAALHVFSHTIASDLYLDETMVEPICKELQKIIQKDKGLKSRLHQCVFVWKDVDALCNEATMIRAKLVNSKPYRKYWLSHCHTAKDGTCTNDLIHAKRAESLWAVDDNKFILAPPADTKSFDSDYAAEMECYKMWWEKNRLKYAV